MQRRPDSASEFAAITDARIQRMKWGEIENIEACKRTRLAELERRRNLVVSIASVCSGQLVIT